MPVNKCSDCIFCKEQGEGWCCKCKAPTPQENDHKFAAIWPTVDPDDIACGEFEVDPGPPPEEPI